MSARVVVQGVQMNRKLLGASMAIVILSACSVGDVQLGMILGEPAELELESSRGRVQGVRNCFAWPFPPQALKSSCGASTGAPDFPDTLRVSEGDEITIHGPASVLPYALLVTEYNRNGIPLVSSVLEPISGGTQYVPRNTGQFPLEVTARWAWGQYVTYIFQIHVRP